jgi:hypothetical protein
LVGSWVHSHEEDHDGIEVYRPGDFDFPPSRGRSSFTLRADSTAAAGFPGPVDSGSVTDDGTWMFEGDVLDVRCPGLAATYHVVAADPEHLELRPA